MKAILLICVIALLAGCTFASPAPTAAPTIPPTVVPLKDVTVLPRASRPNFLFIFVDDLDAKLGTLQYMLHLQELLTSQGLTIDNFLISTPVCCPSRSSVLRGQYAQNHEVLTNAPPLGGFEKFYALQHESSTLATWLQAAGYRTALFGKYLNGYPPAGNRTYIPPGWSTWYSPARGTPYKEQNYYLNENGTLVGYGLGADEYLTDVLARKVDDYLKNTASDPQPFFIYLAPYAPHEPATPAPQDAKLFPDLQAPRTPSFNEADVSDKPGNIRADPLLTADQIAKIDELYRQRVRSMQAVDRMIAQLIGTLQASGKLDNTYIIFSSDNGYHLGQHRLLAGKNRPYEEDIVVPLILRGPGVPAGQELKDSLVGNTDIGPTIADLAGVVPPAYVDGRSIAPLWSADRPSLASWRQGYLIEDWGSDDQASASLHPVSIGGIGPSTGFFGAADGLLEPADPDQLLQAGPPADFYGVRTVQYMYVEYSDGERELYDLKQDPYELSNLISTADSSLLAQFSAWLKALRACAAASCRTAEQIGLH
ncbi:MAG TPA: sulfatase [Anaerolineales bacterium]